MSAGGAVVQADLCDLAPKFRAAVEAALDECHALGLDAMVWEALRSEELQALYYRRGRPPTKAYPRIVTHARSNLYSWHGYGLAVDVVSEEKLWSPDPDWWGEVAAVFLRYDCDWGGEWKQVDLPHFQWGRLKASPSDRARQLYRDGGMQRVWREVGAA